MTILILGAVGVLVFVLGILFMSKGCKGIPAADAVVSRSDFEALEKNFKGAKDVRDKAEGELQSAKTELNSAKKNLDALQKTEEEIRKQLDLTRKEIEEIKQESEARIIEDSDAMEKLEAANELLRKKEQAASARLAEITNQISAMQKDESDRAQGAADVIKKLESEIETLQKGSGSENESEITRITEEINQAKTLGAQKAKEAAEAIEDLIAQNKLLKKDRDGIAERVKELEVSDNSSVGSSSSELDDFVENLKGTNEILKKENEDSGNKIYELEQELEALKQGGSTQAASDGTSQAAVDLKELDDLRKCNDILFEKERAIRHEFAKGKAQVAGLEKICTDLRNKLDKLQGREDAPMDIMG